MKFPGFLSYDVQFLLIVKIQEFKAQINPVRSISMPGKNCQATGWYFRRIYKKFYSGGF